MSIDPESTELPHQSSPDEASPPMRSAMSEHKPSGGLFASLRRRSTEASSSHGGGGGSASVSPTPRSPALDHPGKGLKPYASREPPPSSGNDDEDILQKQGTFKRIFSKLAHSNSSSRDSIGVHTAPTSPLISSSKSPEENFEAILKLRSSKGDSRTSGVMSADDSSLPSTMGRLSSKDGSQTGSVVARGLPRTRNTRSLRGAKLVRDIDDGISAAFALNPHAALTHLMKEKELATKTLANGTVMFRIESSSSSSANPMDSDGTDHKEEDEPSVSQSATASVSHVTMFRRFSGPEDKRIEKRRLVIQELVETEKSYVAHLDSLVNVYEKPMKEQAAALNLTLKDVSEMFGNIEILKNFHAKFQKELDNSRDSIPQTFLKYADFFRMYFDYCGKYDAAVSKLHGYTKETAFRTFLQTQAEQVKGQDITSFLIMPVQRIPRYELLLKEMRKYSNDESEAEAITSALEKIHSLAELVNEKTAEFERTAKLMQIQNQLKGHKEDFTIFCASRHLIDQFDCEEILVYHSALKDRYRYRPRRLYLFTDMIMWVNGEFEFRGHYSLKSKALSVNDYAHSSADSDHKPYCLEISHMTERVLISCATEDMKHDMIKAILIVSEYAKDKL
eukprot:TRINITY_DN6681_c0_g1_i1.p1 TRINITY_DN6681_c0_g1~~TRINITY_DN6681_c0_g1_i1.p1  ORF type:complete len:620 (-),score=154.88 TRINITY_DN6681_c0_g1_i1:44-1903(-)